MDTNNAVSDNPLDKDLSRRDGLDELHSYGQKVLEKVLDTEADRIEAIYDKFEENCPDIASDARPWYGALL